MSQKPVAVRVPPSAALARAVPAPARPTVDQTQGNYQTKTFTFLTTAGGRPDILYSADQPWARVTLLLETAGPVAVATSQQFTPVLSGKGLLLTTGAERAITLPKGSRLYIASPTVNRVSVIIEPLPWLEQILGGIIQGFTGLVSFLGKR